jgi:hypothetical protein
MYRFEAHRDLNWLESHAHSKWESKQRELRVEALVLRFLAFPAVS